MTVNGANKFAFEQSKAIEFGGGTLHRATRKNFPVLRGLAIQALHLKPGIVREMHVHPNANQLDYCVRGRARVGIVGPEGHRQVFELEPGDISFVPQGYLHWIDNIGSEPLHFLVVLSHEEPETIELSEMLAGIPRETLIKTFGFPSELADQVPDKAIIISGGSVL